MHKFRTRREFYGWLKSFFMISTPFNNISGRKCNSFSLLPTEKVLERDKFMSPDEARDFGLIDRVLSHPPSMGKNSLNDAEKSDD